MAQMTSHCIEPAPFAGQLGEDPGDEVFVELAGVPMVFCWCPQPAAPFLMGSPESEADRGSDETPHQVLLSSGFWLAKHPCNQGQYAAVTGNNPSHFNQGDEWPVDSVSWDDAKAFCEKAGGALSEDWQLGLPTEAQWEYACRAGGVFELPFGTGDGRNLHSQSANFWVPLPYGDGFDWLNRAETLPEGCLPPNAWGLHDMHGQLWEWCEDWRGKYEKSTEDKPVIDPTGAKKGGKRVLRGGSWDYFGRFCRSGQRFGYPPAGADFIIGFRPILVHQKQIRKRSGGDA